MFLKGHRMEMNFNILAYMLLTIHCTTASLKLGIDTIDYTGVSEFLNIKKRPINVGLITNQTGVDHNKIPTAHRLHQKGFKIPVFFTTEHGFEGTIQAEKTVVNTRDKKNNIPVVSVYDAADTQRKERINQILNYRDTIDVLVFDMQDVGMRHYTYVSTLYELMEFAGLHKIPFIVLDRPNPLGALVEGPMVNSQLVTFISRLQIPLRHGLTIGEIARYTARYLLPQPPKLAVAPMQNYCRVDKLELIVPLSPNIKTIRSCYGYCFLGLLGELEPFDVGVKTKYPFEYLTIPVTILVKQKFWHELAEVLKSAGIESKFCSYYSEHRKQQCKGLKINIPDINQCSTMQALEIVLSTSKKHAIPIVAKKSFIGTRSLFDTAMGEYLYEAFSEDKLTSKQRNKINHELKSFYKKAQSILLYKDGPCLKIIE